MTELVLALELPNSVTRRFQLKKKAAQWAWGHEVAQGVRALTLAEDLSTDPSTHVEVHNSL